MKFKVTAYSFTVCLVSVTALFFYLDFRMTPHRMENQYLSSTVLNSPRIGEINQTEIQQYQLKPSVHKLQSRQNTVETSTTTAISTLEDTFTEPPIVLSKAHIIAVISYMRSGSSLTGDILQHFAGTLYVFEPLHMLVRRVTDGKPLVYLDGRKVFLKPENLTDEFLLEEVHKWFQCRFNDLDFYTLSDGFHQLFSRSMRSLIQCWTAKRRTVKSIRLCLPNVIQKCLNAKQRLFKFIRLPIRLIQRVYSLYPNLQVIHLLRDPRGTLTSQSRLRRFRWSDISAVSKAYCDRVTDDINATVHLNYADEKRAKILIYENLAEDPINTAKRLYNYVGLPIRDNVLEYIRKLTLDGRRRPCAYCIIRSNSTVAAYTWRNVIKYDYMVVIDNHCPVVYGYIGYLRLSAPSELKNHIVPTHHTPNMSIII